MNRGSITVSRIWIPGLRSFNEAPIHESGKLQAAKRHGWIEK